MVEVGTRSEFWGTVGSHPQNVTLSGCIGYEFFKVVEKDGCVGAVVAFMNAEELLIGVFLVGYRDAFIWFSHDPLDGCEVSSSRRQTIRVSGSSTTCISPGPEFLLFRASVTMSKGHKISQVKIFASLAITTDRLSSVDTS
uniref:Uncharacterized protein n=1 Tax=Physcomitrium patens TaxID=3218 RepID=A0A2K1L3T8_PHYPA|nr:hypothetical protein PHYPA_003480 [Physcomitrium patens]